MEKKKSGFGSVYLFVLGVITVICVIVGLKVHAVGADLGKQKSGNIEIGACEELNIDIDRSSVEIVKGTKWDIEYKDVPEKIIPKVSNENGKMKITQKKVKGFVFNFGFIGNTNSGGKVIISVPDDANKIELDAKLDVGSLKISDIAFADVTADVDVGKVKITNIEADKLTVDADTGEIHIADSTAVDSEIKADVGNIEIENFKCDKIDADGDVGNIDIEAAFKKLEAKADVGSIDVQFKDDLCSEDEVKVSLKSDVGSVKYNGEKHGKKFEK